MTDYYVDYAGDDSTGDGSISNPWGTPGYGMSHCTSHGDVCYVKYNASPYVLSSNTPGASGGPVLFSSGILSKLEGYESTPGDHCPNGNRPEINAGSVTFSSLTFLIEMAGSTSYPHFVNNVRVNGNSVTYAGGIKGNGSTQTFVHRAQIANAYNYGMNALFATECHITGTTGYGVVESSAAHCWADNNTQYGFTGTGKLFFRCMSSNNSRGFSGYNSQFVGCGTYNNSSNGFGLYRGNTCDSCISVNDTGYAFETDVNSMLIRCWSYNPTSGRKYVAPLYDIAGGSLSADPFVAAASGDFRINNTPGGGAVLRAMGIAP